MLYLGNQTRHLGAKILCGLIVSALWSAAESAPKMIYGVYAPRSGEDFIRITPRDNGKAGLALKLYYANGHTCQLDKEGEWRGDHLLVVADGLNENEPCKLEVFFSKGQALLKDPGGRCARVYCGSRGKLDDVSLPKRRPARK